MAGTSDNKAKRQTGLRQLTAKDLRELQAEINAPNDTMFKIMTTVRKRLGQKAIEKNANQAVVEGGRTLEDFYVAENIAMEVKKSEEIDEKEKI